MSRSGVTRGAARVRFPRMKDTWPLLDKIPFPAIARGRLETLQVNVGYRCNQSCVHCHVNAGPNRTEEMDATTADLVIEFLERRRISTLDITGGAPELNANFRRMVSAARDMAVKVMDRHNLTVQEQPGQEDLAEFLAANQVEIVASMPCYLQDNVDKQRGKGVYDGSIRGLKRLNALGYGREGSGLTLNLVYNPLGPSLPPPQLELEADYKRVLERALRHRVQQPVHARQHADPALRRDPALARPVRRLSAYAATRASRRQSCRRDVPQPAVRRLSRLRL